MGSKKITVLFVIVFATLVAIPAFADSRLQGTWLLEGPAHKGIIFSGSNFVIIDSEDMVHLVGSFTASGNTLTLNFTHGHNVVEDLWVPIRETERHNFSFRANNILVIGNEVYRRS